MDIVSVQLNASDQGTVTVSEPLAQAVGGADIVCNETILVLKRMTCMHL
jgi:hypothetical protein